MANKKITLPVFVLLALLQLYVPAKMILDREDILHSGKEYKFKTQPIDPNDPFRGKFIALYYEEAVVEIQSEADWLPGERIFVILTTDKDGFAKAHGLAKEYPADNQDFLKARVGWVTDNGTNMLTIEYPFDRYYMEESKAYDAELAYLESQVDSTQTAYAVVGIKEGEAVLKEVLINGVPIRELVINRRKDQK
ncbi:GDYXXLXY domain-containing protein [Cyclobacterium plantarum]|uniref:GDYXXLXY domain-containing protein n=1 Tax=Cyclobacterium plantarum TaxID=2716263 RepID=UPI003F6FA392